MFKHYYKMDINEYKNMNYAENLKNQENSENSKNTKKFYDFDLLKNNCLSPAEIVNIRVFSNTPDEFIDNLFYTINSKL